MRLLTLLVELNKMGKTILVATHDLNLIRQAKSQIAARVLRITERRIQLGGGRPVTRRTPPTTASCRPPGRRPG